MAIKKPNRWNRFMKTTGARAVFRGRQKGVKHRPAMGGVSDLYWELSPEERALFADPPPPETLIPADYPNEHHTAEEESIAAEAERGQRQTISFKRASDHVQNFMESWVQQAPWATPFSLLRLLTVRPPLLLLLATLMVNDTTLLVCKPTLLAMGPDKGPTGIGKGSHVLTTEKTNGAMTTWPWTKTDFKLAKIKYRLVLLPGAKIQASWIKSPSRNLHTAPKTILHTDLDDKLIDVVYDPTIPDGISSDYVLTPEFLKAPLPSSSCSRSSPSSSTPSLHSDDDMSSDE
ncbi:hypothetical protein PtA15_3A368 [Puccinia triticina]|uniref:Uncharacterized protein n=1 Tax=Puccinia triticina TaxID=208348 RepID=A0ABY7CEU1_9BASI|nr:uncharacterized protein PtA15_3A368 [Puccinia triticina]WAQ83002.1 hypothetical protein PtA15_3A368 [Puccinia triticina]